jgi:hypothetical protein
MALKIEDILIPESGSPCDTWKVYFTKLKKKCGADTARNIWLYTWSVNGSTSCTTNEGFNKFLKQHEIDVSTSATRVVADMGSIGENIMGSFKTMSKIVPVVAGITMIAVLGTVLFILFRTAKEVKPTDIVALVPQGRAAMVAGKLLKG